ncbi:forkhead box protein J1-A-like [Scleropages formosus]|uniref:Forkhead box protein J1-A-like n=1 Tax=Scleropages formosus TaxID=113540 RepID=A0A8C9RZP2_SCLFO|nr:forkhead box protein J1-A-like [Scleropages formosus]
MSLSGVWSDGSVGFKGDDLAHSSNGLVTMDDRLTNLGWLQEFTISVNRAQKTSSHQNQIHLCEHQKMVSSDVTPLPTAQDPVSMDTPRSPGFSTSMALKKGISSSSLPSLVTHGHCPQEVDYKTNPNVRPPYSYATLICMAMQASKSSKITLSYIYEWIKENFCYFRHVGPSWQNSIRHSLSVNKCFIKVPRQKGGPEKRGFWTIDPRNADQLLRDAYKKTRMPSVKINPAFQALVKPSPIAHSGFPPAVEGVVSVSPESKNMWQEFRQVTGADQNWDPSKIKRAVPRSGKRCNFKRKRANQNRMIPAKMSRHFSSPLLSFDEQESQGPLKDSTNWVVTLENDQDQAVHNTHISCLQQRSPSEVSEDSEGTHIMPLTQENILDLDNNPATADITQQDDCITPGSIKQLSPIDSNQDLAVHATQTGHPQQQNPTEARADSEGAHLFFQTLEEFWDNDVKAFRAAADSTWQDDCETLLDLIEELIPESTVQLSIIQDNPDLAVNTVDNGRSQQQSPMEVIRHSEGAYFFPQPKDETWDFNVKTFLSSADTTWQDGCDALLNSIGELNPGSTVQLSSIEDCQDLGVNTMHTGPPQQQSLGEARVDSEDDHFFSQPQEETWEFNVKTFLTSTDHTWQDDWDTLLTGELSLDSNSKLSPTWQLCGC